MRRMREGAAKILGSSLSSSLFVMLSMIVMNRFILAALSFSLPWSRGVITFNKEE